MVNIEPNSFGKLHERSLIDFEKKTEIKLPVEYRDFLLESNGGKPSPSFFWIIPDFDGSEVNQFYGLYEDPNPFSIVTYSGTDRYGIPISMLPVGDDGLGNHICIGIEKSIFGIVYFIDHDLHPFTEPDSMEGITKIANSFTEFLVSLIKSPKQ